MDIKRLVHGRMLYVVLVSESTVELREIRLLTKPMGLEGLYRRHGHLAESDQLERYAYRVRGCRSKKASDPFNTPALKAYYTGPWVIVDWTREWSVTIGWDRVYSTGAQGRQDETPLRITCSLKELLSSPEGTFFSRRAAWRYFVQKVSEMEVPKPKPKPSSAQYFYEWRPIIDPFERVPEDRHRVLKEVIADIQSSVVRTMALPRHLVEGVSA